MYAVIDTNILVLAQLTRHEDSATRQIVRAVFNGCITPVITSAILDEYQLLSPEKSLKFGRIRTKFYSF